jgi:ribose transport system substrate-binding protein
MILIQEKEMSKYLRKITVLRVDGMNIKEIAKKAGVSIATVSHVVNKTRYVSPELTERVLQVIRESSDEKANLLLRKWQSQTSRIVLCLLDNFLDEFAVDVTRGIHREASRLGYDTVVIHTGNKGLIHEYIKLEKPCGMIHVSDVGDDDHKIKRSELMMPTVSVVYADHQSRGEANGDLVISDGENAYRATEHLLKNGHERICLVYHAQEGVRGHSVLDGYKQALANGGVPFDQELVIDASLQLDYSELGGVFLSDKERPTAAIIASDRATMELVKFLRSHNLECPDDVSLISLQESTFHDMMHPSITTFAHDPEAIGAAAMGKLLEKISAPGQERENIVVSGRLIVRDSTQCIGRGPFGEKAESPEVLNLTKSEMEQIKSGSYTAAISFHYSGTAWARLHEKGIKDVFSELGIKVVAVTDAHFDAELQIRQLGSIMAMNPDVLISIPADEIITAESYREVVRKGVKLVLINNVPSGFTREDYVTCVSVNERENGRIAGRILGEYLIRNQKSRVGLLIHGAPFFATKQRDMSAEQVLLDEFPGLDIVAKEQFVSEKNVFDKCYELIKRHPEIEGLYVSWEGPALEVLKALQELKRTDIAVVTADLDSEVAMNMALGGPMKGLSAQRPYEQGMAMAMAAANALIGKSVPAYIGVTPYRITTENLLSGWQEVLKERPPVELVSAVKKKPVQS